MDIQAAAQFLTAFGDDSLSDRVRDLERLLAGASASELAGVLSESAVTAQTLDAALVIKDVAGQINVVVHALGIALTLPHILEPGERVQYVSLGAGNTGREFDLETDRRIAEFKFISWRGGAEAIRQNQLFKDFYLLAESESPKRKELYVTGARHPLRFLNGGRALRSVLSRNNRLWEEVQQRYGDRFRVVRDYYAFGRESVSIVDLYETLPQVFRPAITKALEQAEESMELGSPSRTPPR